MARDWFTSTPKTKDEMTDVVLHGRTYPVVDGVVKIPTKRGDMVIKLDNSGKRKDWQYDMTFGKSHFLMVDFNNMVESLHSIIDKTDLLTGAVG